MARQLQSFRDILEARREESSNFMWISRKLNPAVAFKQNIKPTPTFHKQEVLKSYKIQDLIVKVSENRKCSKEKVEQEVKLILDEIGFNKRLSIIRWLGLFLTKVCLRVCQGIYINEEHIIRTKNVMGDSPVMFLPSHRSYADFILMSYVCFTYNIEIPAIAAGMDFHGMWGMGAMLRDTGAFFMRRSYNDDSLYWDTFRQYVHQLVTKGDLALEFFIEGTRSRTGKSLTPKYGLLSMVLKSFFMGEVPDIIFVPINISYDRVLEEKLFAFELLGVPKPKESTSGFFKSLSLVNERYGNIYVDFGEPISAKTFFNKQIDRSIHSMKPVYIQEITQNERDATTLLAQNIVSQQQKCCIITTFNIVALSLINKFTNQIKDITLDDLISEVVWLNTILLELDAVSDLKNPKHDILQSLNIHKGLVHVNSSGQVTLSKNPLVASTTNYRKLKGHTLSGETMTYVVPFIQLQIYVNPVLHYLVNPSIVVTILKHNEGLSEDVLFGHFGFLRSLLSYEFVTLETQDYLNFCEASSYLRKLGLLENLDNGCVVLKNEALVQMLCNAIEPFFYIYYVVCRVLHQDATVVWNEKNVAEEVQMYFESIINRDQVFIHPYCLNLDSVSNCLNKLSTLAVLTKRKVNGDTVYQTNHEKLKDIVLTLEKYVRLIPLDEELHILQNKVCLDSKL